MVEFHGKGTVEVENAWVAPGETIPQPDFEVSGWVQFDGPWVHVRTSDKGEFLSFPAKRVTRVKWQRSA